jgi:DNA invertase Pin-like site-specific DNA recombinase
MYASTQLYARVSTPKQDTLSQIPRLLEWAVKENCKPTLVQDVGSGKNMDRKGIRSIITGILAGEVKRVVVVSINRVGRNLRQCLEFFDLCHKHGIELISLREKVDLSSPMGRCLVHLLSVIGELENEQRSAATRDGQARKKAECERLGIAYYPNRNRKGYSLKVTPEKAASIFHLKEQGKSFRKIAKAVGLSDKTVRDVVLHPRDEYISRKEQAKRLRGA